MSVASQPTSKIAPVPDATLTHEFDLEPPIALAWITAMLKAATGRYHSGELCWSHAGSPQPCGSQPGHARIPFAIAATCQRSCAAAERVSRSYEPRSSVDQCRLGGK